MNLGKKYKQLFEGKTRSNDSSLLKENANPKVQAVYDKVYQFTDTMDDQALEIMDTVMEKEGTEELLSQWLAFNNDGEGTALTPIEEKKLIAALEIAVEVLENE